ncbi:hypothetical protein OTB20_35780 [Streptomyces sp. H27-H1]|nr:hypothetical protein [Streptomyces sp. H27-H1]
MPEERGVRAVRAEQAVDQGDEAAVRRGQLLEGERGQSRVELGAQGVAASQEFGFEPAQGGPGGRVGRRGCRADVEGLESTQQYGLDSGYGCFPPRT